jgi:hypothetical protein
VSSGPPSASRGRAFHSARPLGERRWRRLPCFPTAAVRRPQPSHP